MPATKRTTIYFDLDVYEALKERAAAAKSSISKIVNELVRQSLIDYLEDAQEQDIIERRRAAANIPVADVVAELKRRGFL